MGTTVLTAKLYASSKSLALFLKSSSMAFSSSFNLFILSFTSWASGVVERTTLPRACISLKLKPNMPTYQPEEAKKGLNQALIWLPLHSKNLTQVFIQYAWAASWSSSFPETYSRLGTYVWNHQKRKRKKNSCLQHCCTLRGCWMNFSICLIPFSSATGIFQRNDKHCKPWTDCLHFLLMHTFPVQHESGYF